MDRRILWELADSSEAQIISLHDIMVLQGTLRSAQTTIDHTHFLSCDISLSTIETRCGKHWMGLYRAWIPRSAAFMRVSSSDRGKRYQELGV